MDIKQLTTFHFIRPRLCALTAFILLFFAFPASAYVLQGAHVLDLTAKALGKATTLQAGQQVTLYNLNASDGPALFDETVSFLFPDGFRSDLVTQTITRTHISRRGRAISVINGKRAGFLEKRFKPYRSVLTFHSRTALLRSLTLLGIDVSITSLGRFNDRIVYVLGARYPDSTVSQVWIDKALFLPLKLVLVTKSRDPEGVDDRVEIHYEDWRKIGNIQFPMHLVFYTDDLKSMEINVADVKVDLSFPENFMSVEQLALEVQETQEGLKTSKEKETVNEVRKTIEDFKKLYE